MTPPPRLWTELDESALTANLHTLQQAAGPATELLAVIKANAYGHGAERCAPPLVRAGARWLGVTSAGEGLRVRRTLAAQNLATDILVMSGSLPEETPTLAAANLTPVVWTSQQIQSLANSPVRRVHLEIDTGMGRQGVRIGPALTQLLDLLRRSNLILDGVFTHLSSSELLYSEHTRLQRKRFEEAIALIHATGLRPAWVHAGNSSTLDNPTQSTGWLPTLASTVGARAMVRTGIALYGYTLPLEPTGESVTPQSVEPEPRVHSTLRPVLTWKTRVLAIHELNPGDTIGYNETFVAPRKMRVALLPVGYADGLRRELSSTSSTPGGWVILHGHRAPILGRISMNLTVVSADEIPNLIPGDEAILLGPGITADDHARLALTIPYEILCNLRSDTSTH